MNYSLNTEAAKAADAMNSRLDETGKYIGVFTRAESVTSEKGAVGIDLSFKSEDGRTADYLSVWTHGKDGSEIYGFKQLMAIMTCLRVKQLTKTPGTVEKFDKGVGAKVQVKADIYPELMGKPVGLLLQRAAYIKGDGSEGHKLNIAGVFEAGSELTASEILGKKTAPELLAKMVAVLKDKPLSGKSATPPKSSATAGGAFDYLDQDIPF